MRIKCKTPSNNILYNDFFTNESSYLRQESLNSVVSKSGTLKPWETISFNNCLGYRIDYLQSGINWTLTCFFFILITVLITLKLL